MGFLEKFIDEYKSEEGLRQIGDTRKPKLTLYHLNKLKKIEAVKKLENIRRSALLKTIYGKPKEDEGGF